MSSNGSGQTHTHTTQCVDHEVTGCARDTAKSQAMMVNEQCSTSNNSCNK